MAATLRSEDTPEYRVPFKSYGELSAEMRGIIAQAISILEQSVQGRDILRTPNQVRDWLRLRLATKQYEVFAVLFLDAQNRLIRAVDMFHGSLTQASVYPREVVREALSCNAGAVILAHNHPSGVAEPSKADQVLTETLKQALALIEVKVLDHFIVSQSESVSFVERGLL
jgi:DNA repair protein RadC